MSALPTPIPQFFESLLAKDLDGAFSHWSEDCVFEMPYTPPGLKGAYHGRQALKAFFTVFAASLSDMAFNVSQIYETTDQNIVLVEAQGHCKMASGRSYNNSYLWIFRVANSKIVHFREYNNPLVVQSSFGDAATLQAAFG